MEFQCDYKKDSVFGYDCTVVKIVKTSSAANAILITGKHIQGKSNDSVRLFRIENQPLDTFPRNIHEKFSNLTILWINRCGLKKISKTDLIGLENLERLNLYGNELTSLPDDLFTGMKRLREINFDDNKLERLSSKLLEPVATLLEIAWFQGNTKIDEFFNKYDQNKNLKRLMDIMDRLEPALPETEHLPEPMSYTDRENEHHKQMVVKFAEFRASCKFTDFTIKVRGKEFKVHKNILAAQSPIFLQTFTNDVETTEKTFTKEKNFSEESFGSFLDFFYTGKVDHGFNALEVLELASVFEVAILKAICTDKIAADLSEENALEVFNIANHHESDQLKQAAFKIIQKMLPDLPDRTVDNPEQVNSLVKAKCEYEAMLQATKKLYSNN